MQIEKLKVWNGPSRPPYVGHHMYGASVRDGSCSRDKIIFVNRQGKPHCFYIDEEPKEYVNIAFDPGLSETLSPVSSAPQRVCLCDSNGKPQCANISYIFTNTSVYRGETITLSACIVGYDFGTAVGTIHARFLSHNSSKRDKSQLVIDSGKCFPFNYTVYSKRDYELLLLQTSSRPVSAVTSNESTEYDIFNYEHMIKHEIPDYISHNQSGCNNTNNYKYHLTPRLPSTVADPGSVIGGGTRAKRARKIFDHAP